MFACPRSHLLSLVSHLEKRSNVEPLVGEFLPWISTTGLRDILVAQWCVGLLVGLGWPTPVPGGVGPSFGSAAGFENLSLSPKQASRLEALPHGNERIPGVEGLAVTTILQCCLLNANPTFLL